MTPTEDPPFAGLTKSGSGRASARARSPGSRSTTARGVGIPASRRIALKTPLSIPTADAVTPAPTYGTPTVSRKPWSAPSSPVVPWTIGNTTSTRPGATSAGTTAVPVGSAVRKRSGTGPDARSARDSGGGRNRPASLTAIGTTS